ncbi:unnamed protein product [Moneuplotes crassus]|uniref:Uncharacterized protein n=1 Tax=Euplotes crassus TaxID=5936 RepID=A0AAD2DBG1_EUPCR|nr:unnamed protein product [Moneuplotes crassus]
MKDKIYSKLSLTGTDSRIRWINHSKVRKDKKPLIEGSDIDLTRASSKEGRVLMHSRQRPICALNLKMFMNVSSPNRPAESISQAMTSKARTPFPKDSVDKRSGSFLPDIAPKKIRVLRKNKVARAKKDCIKPEISSNVIRLKSDKIRPQAKDKLYFSSFGQEKWSSVPVDANFPPIKLSAKKHFSRNSICIKRIRRKDSKFMSKSTFKDFTNLLSTCN